MKLWKISTQTLAVLLAAVTSVHAGGPTDGEATADPDSAVVKLTGQEYESFIKENPLILAEFFAPWCGYCKQLGPEFSKAADALNDSHPNIKLAQIDCTVEESLCSEKGIRGYPTLKVLRGPENDPEDYAGPRDADGIAKYMVQQSLPPVIVANNISDFEEIVLEETKPYIVQIASSEATNATFNAIAAKMRNDFTFINVDSKDLIKELNSKYSNVKLSPSKNKYLVVHPSEFDDVREFSGDVTEEALSDFVKSEVIPYFDDIGRENFMTYMSSPLPLAYYFYNTEDERKAVENTLKKLGKTYKNKINFVGLDALVFGRHAESLNMDPEIVPLFAIQHLETNKKYGINQSEHPEGPSVSAIEDFVKDFLAGKVSPIIKSEPLPTEEEVTNLPVVKLVAHNHDDVLKDLSKDVFVKYYAPWCGHCKKLAPTWEELAVIYDSNKPDSQVVIANIDATANDVETSEVIDGFPKLIFYPANGKVDEKGFRESIVYESPRDLDSLIDFIKESSHDKVDGHKVKEQKSAEGSVEDDEESEESSTKGEHDEL
ncbi:uncharacterized protein PRCAT00003596001 [Priceomyces carsonii]|uniref:uncharacterized protein n=1 Tax=Priceomyces carsonii TaxID=28549 RepID=UPI002ED7B567|nr:unnamed protein product [Priceomyces carsonii]